ncbi:MAG: Uma2 family endonuclease [Hydrogenophilaceae bacterium]|jgi:Uma2 family endonuclease|nr:Uma2 family endonuclease [Hydrogenophilaceae bacterium]
MPDTGSPVTRAAEGLNRHRFSVKDVERMLKDGVLDPAARFELLDGEIVPMAPMHVPHAAMSLAIAAWFLERLEAPLKALAGVMTVLSSHSQVDPDIVIYRAGAKKTVAAASVRLAIEVADAALAKDLRVKARLHGEAGIPEYWVIDLKKRITHVHRRPGTGAWTKPKKVAFAEKLAPLFDKRLALRIDDLDL